jgi:ABC-type methionine transport system ATPase subunit
MAHAHVARVKLTFPEHLIRQPVIARLVREFDVMPNIRRASVEESVGWMVLEIGGEDDTVDHALEWLKDQGVEVDLLGDMVEG